VVAPILRAAQIVESIDQCMNHRMMPNERDSYPRVLFQGNAGADSHELDVILRHHDISSFCEVVNDVVQVIQSCTFLYLYGIRVQFRGGNLHRHAAQDTKVFPNQFNQFPSLPYETVRPKCTG
jgi:hypothetical protein